MPAAPLLTAGLVVALPVLAFLMICMIGEVQFIGTFLVGLGMVAFAVLWLFEVRRLVDQP